MRSFRVVGGVVLAFCVLQCWPLGAQERGGRAGAMPRVQPLPQQMTAVARVQQLLAEKNVAATRQAEIVQRFQTLPADLQEVVLAALDPAWAARANLPSISEIVRAGRVIVRVSPYIQRIFPDYGQSPGAWAYVMGVGLAEGDVVLWDNVAQPTTFMSPGDEFFPNSLAFRIPAGTALGTTHQVRVRRNEQQASNTVSYRCVAPRGYRGYFGWKFHNFSAPVIGWHLFRDFFGRTAVEYPDGTHRPAAQAWYDSTYARVGSGGNCYGMSVSSLRIRNRNMTTYHRQWFIDHPQPFCWLYEWCTETKESVQEDQGGQLSAEMAATLNDYWNHQNHKTAWERSASLVSEPSNRPVICFWHTGHWGHAVVGYSTSISGSQRRIFWYDNNEPYAENETGGPDRSWGYVDWNNGSFYANSYSAANKMICLSYNECTRTPHLPTEAGGPGASATGTVIAVVEGGQVQQIEDENGRRFYAADGTENTDLNTRIPDSMRFIPLEGANVEYTGPAIYVFNQATNKSLLFTIGGGGAKRLRVLQPGSVMETAFNGQGQIRCSELLTPGRSLELLNPGQLNPTEIRYIHVLATERVFHLQNLNLGAGAFVLRPLNAAGEGLNVQTGARATFDLRLETFARNAAQQALFRGVQTEAGSRAALQPGDWGALRRTSLNVNLQTLNNQPLRQLRINQ